MLDLQALNSAPVTVYLVHRLYRCLHALSGGSQSTKPYLPGLSHLLNATKRTREQAVKVRGGINVQFLDKTARFAH
jgi:hypothetical protein